MRPIITRRALLGAAVLLPLAGCAKNGKPERPVSASASAAPPDPNLSALEERFGARLGVHALAIGSGAVVEHRADERFAFCSTFKALAAAAVLARNPLSHLETVVKYGEADLMKHAPITAKHVSTGMTIRDLCDAAVRYSDGTAGNLLLRDLGGPAELTAYVRGLGDEVFRMDRTEPDITEATPGDPRDTTSPRAYAGDLRRIVLGEALPVDKRGFLVDLLKRNLTGDERIRAGLPDDWIVADKTGTGDYGTANDFAVAWPPSGEPLVIGIMTSRETRDAAYDQALLAEAAAYVAGALT
ncbi:class A beta-lactamase [Phytomonospora endophytica]|nr:beta-lactamase [Phytomonospora endophytica]